MSKTLKIVIAAVVAVVLVGGAGVWYFALRDTADKTADVSAIGGGTTLPGPAKSTADGNWKVQQDPTVFAGYRMQELFAAATIKKTATGHSPAVTGTMTISGTTVSGVEVNVDVTKLKSDEDRRDAQMAKRGLETDKFKTATFKQTKPLTLPSKPVDGQQISATITGDLTLHGVTKSVDVPVNATWSGNTIKVATTGDGLPINLSDYGMAAVEVPAFVKTDDHGSLELQLLFVPA